MEVVLEVCDICGKKHGMMLNKDGIVFGDRSCFLDYCNALWLQWEKEEFEARGVLHRKTAAATPGVREFEKKIQSGSAILFKRKIAN